MKKIESFDDLAKYVGLNVQIHIKNPLVESGGRGRKKVGRLLDSTSKFPHWNDGLPEDTCYEIINSEEGSIKLLTRENLDKLFSISVINESMEIESFNGLADCVGLIIQVHSEDSSAESKKIVGQLYCYKSRENGEITYYILDSKGVCIANINEGNFKDFLPVEIIQELA